MGDITVVVREAIDKLHILDTFHTDSDYFECACGWQSAAEFVPNRYLEFEKHKDEIVAAYFVPGRVPPRKIELPDPFETPSHIYIRALIMQKHRPDEFGCSCGSIMVSGDYRQLVFDAHINGLLERVLDAMEKEIGGDCRG